MSKQERATRTRCALIRSAAAVFERHGYVQARLALISSGAGVSTGALHFHFENKAAVAAAVAAEASRSLRAVSCRIRRRKSTALQALTDTSHALADLLRRDAVTRAGFRLSCDGDRIAEPDLRAEWQSFVRELLDEAADEGALVDGVSRKDMAAAIVAATTGFEVLGRRDPEWLSPYSLTGFWQLMLPRLAVPEALALLNPAGADAAGAGPGMGLLAESVCGASQYSEPEPTARF
ncbi:ScbR family autoregulator-binding transcription factor [Streptomyces sp. NPDC051219]|uniref:ScbR family autoregulator-binding transcription factor n=1 Tax=Streptomyces sp. NPDC051219 TaxID=3155283 RepID=UPI003415312E